MANMSERVEKELKELVEGADRINYLALFGDDKSDATSLVGEYQAWYSLALRAVAQLMPDRLVEFQELYKLDKRKEFNASTYTISDYLLGIRVTRGYLKEDVVDGPAVFLSKLKMQVTILRSGLGLLGSTLSDIRGVLQTELFEHEILTCKELLKVGLLRASGALAGVILESHLATVCTNHALTIKKAHPTIADYNEALKNARIFDVPTWRWMQRLADIRNLCAHSKDREPTKDEVEELISGVDKATKTIA